MRRLAYRVGANHRMRAFQIEAIPILAANDAEIGAWQGRGVDIRPVDISTRKNMITSSGVIIYMYPNT